MKKTKILLIDEDQFWLDILTKYTTEALKKAGIQNENITIIVSNTFEKSVQVFEKEEVLDIVILNIILGEYLIELAIKYHAQTIVFVKNDSSNIPIVSHLFKKKKVLDVFCKEHFNPDVFIETIKKAFSDKNTNQNSFFELNSEDEQYLINQLIILATSSMVGAEDYFENLVLSLNLPENWLKQITQTWTKNHQLNATRLIKWCKPKKSYPKQCNKPGYTVLGCLVEQLLEQTNNNELLNIIIRNRLITDENILDSIKDKYL